MAAKHSKAILQRNRSLRFLLTALMGDQSVRISGALLEEVRPDLEEGQSVPDFLASIRALGQRLKAAMARLLEADSAVYHLNARLSLLAARRDELALELARAIVRLRRLVLGHHEKPDLVGLGLYSPRSYRPTPLLRHAGLIVRIFAGDQLERLLGKNAYGDGRPRLPVTLVREAHDELLKVIDEINTARRQLDEAIIRKNELKDEYDILFLNTARTFEAYCRLAGQPRLADRVRPSVRRPGRIEEEPDEKELPPLEARSGGLIRLPQNQPAPIASNASQRS